MTHVKFHNAPLGRSFNGVMDELLNGLPSLLNDDFGNRTTAIQNPVNIRETADAYVLELAAPGFEKADFSVKLDKNILTVSAEKKDKPASPNEKFIRREFPLRGFKRSFTIDEKVDATGIEASYVNGMLVLNLPKKAEVKEAAKEITIK